MKAKELITRAREDYLDDTDSQKYKWNDASMLRKCNEAEKQACSRWNLLYDDVTPEYCEIELVNGQRSYDISTKITFIDSVIWEGEPLTQKTKEQFDRDLSSWRTDTTMTDNEVCFMVQGRKLIFSRIPDATDDGEIVYLEVYRLPDIELTNPEQEFEIPEEYQTDLVYWVLHECYKKQDADSFNQEKSDYYLARFNQVFGNPVPFTVRQNQLESPRQTVVRPVSYKTRTNAVDDDF